MPSLFGLLWTRKKRRSRKLHRGGRVTEKMNCSPQIKFNRITIQSSCYTPNILRKIRDAYNSDPSNKRNPIQADDPQQLWTELNNRLSHCQEEECWLNQLKDSKQKRQIERYVFAPKQPDSWDKNPTTWLTNFDIMNVLEQYEELNKSFEFLGPSPIDFDFVGKDTNNRCVSDELCKFNLQQHLAAGTKQIGVVFNLSEHTHSGSHWVSLFIDTKARTIVFFDSVGSAIPAKIKSFVDKVINQSKIRGTPYKFVDIKTEHQKSNTECGMYSLFFIITMLTGVGENNEQLKSMKRRIDYFKRKGAIQDKTMIFLRDRYFN